VLHAHVPGGLKQETRQRLAVLNAAVPQRLESPAKDLLRDVFREGPVAHAARGEIPQPVAISEGQVLGELLGRELEQAIVGRRVGAILSGIVVQGEEVEEAREDRPEPRRRGGRRRADQGQPGQPTRCW
jgi:hypothetical protein